MHEHDTDLIMSLAQGELDDAAAASAEAEIAACARCRADLELQRLALDALDDTPRVYLTATESARIRSTVKDQLGLKSPTPVPQPRRRRFPLAALAGAAAVLLAIVVAGPALDLFTSGDRESPRNFDDALAPTAPAEEFATPQDAPSPSPPAAPDAAVEEAPSLAAATPESGLGSLTSDTDLENLRALIIESGGPQAFLERSMQTDGTNAASPEEQQDRRLEETELAGESPAAPSDALARACDPSAVTGTDPDATPSVLGSVDYEGMPALVVAYAGETLTELQIVVLALDTCEVLAST